MLDVVAAAAADTSRRLPRTRPAGRSGCRAASQRGRPRRRPSRPAAQPASLDLASSSSVTKRGRLPRTSTASAPPARQREVLSTDAWRGARVSHRARRARWRAASSPRRLALAPTRARRPRAGIPAVVRAAAPRSARLFCARGAVAFDEVAQTLSRASFIASGGRQVFVDGALLARAPSLERAHPLPAVRRQSATAHASARRGDGDHLRCCGTTTTARARRRTIDGVRVGCGVVGPNARALSRPPTRASQKLVWSSSRARTALFPAPPSAEVQVEFADDGARIGSSCSRVVMARSRRAAPDFSGTRAVTRATQHVLVVRSVVKIMPWPRRVRAWHAPEEIVRQLFVS
jgi:hypothetical protein